MVFSSLLFIFAFLPVVWAGFHLLKSEQFAQIAKEKQMINCESKFLRLVDEC